MADIKLLLVEDDENLAYMEKSCFEDIIEGYEVKTAVNGRQGLEEWKTFQPDVIVSDIDMPIMDGLEMVRKIREVDGDTIILFTTDVRTGTGLARVHPHHHQRQVDSECAPAADSQRERSLRSAVHTLSEPRHQQRTLGCLHVVQSGAGGRIAGVGALLSQLRHLLDGCGLHSLYDIVAAGVAGRHQTHHRLALQGCLSRHTSLPVLCGRLYGGNLLSHLLAVEHLPALAGKNHPGFFALFCSHEASSCQDTRRMSHIHEEKEKIVCRNLRSVVWNVRSVIRNGRSVIWNVRSVIWNGEFDK